MKNDLSERIDAHKLLESLRDYPIEMNDFWVVDHYREFERIFLKDGRDGEFFLESTPLSSPKKSLKQVFTCIHVQLAGSRTRSTWYELTLDQSGEVEKQRILNSEHTDDPLVVFFYHLKQGLKRRDWKLAEDKNIIKTKLMKYIKEIWEE